MPGYLLGASYDM